MATLRATYTGTDAKAKAISIVDKAAEKVRQSLDTPIYGQASLYVQKRIEAEKHLNGSTDPTPFLEADVEAYGLTMQEAAMQIMQNNYNASSVLKQVEVIRLKAKKQIRETTGNPFDIAKQAKKDIEAVPNAE